jgi:hypothetical protein
MGGGSGSSPLGHSRKGYIMTATISLLW